MGARQLEVATLFWLRGLSYREVAEILAVRPERVYETIKRLRRIIRALEETSAG